MHFWSRFDAIAREHDVLRHSFYVRWSAGELSAPELADYSGQYRHAVVGGSTRSRRRQSPVAPPHHARRRRRR
jgi:hypothetical protein